MVGGEQGEQPASRSEGRQSPAVRIARDVVLAAAGAAAAALLTVTFADFFEANIFLLFLVAVLAANLLSGWIAGAVASLVSVVLLAGFVFPLRGRFATEDPSDPARLVVFVAASILVGGLCHALLAARERARSREHSLRESTESYRGLFDNTIEAIYLVDRDGVFIEANPAATRMYGYERDELVGMTPEMLATEEQREKDAGLNRVGRAYAGEAQRFEWEAVTRAGEVFPVEVSLSRTRYFGRDVVMAVARDLTEHHRLEEGLRRAQRLEAVGRLAGGVAHDFNNILTSIGGHAVLALDRIDPDDPVREDLEEIQRGTVLAEAVTRQLLAFSRQQVVRPQRIDLNDVIAGTERMLRRLLPGDVTLVTELDPGAGAVRMDPGHLEQVVMNLVVNARDAMPRGGQISVSTTALGNDDGAHQVALLISDTGTGMSEATRAHIFEPFFTTKAVGKGTGLGLSTVYGIVTQAGGTIDVRSTPGSGTTMEIRLPQFDSGTPSDAVPGGDSNASGGAPGAGPKREEGRPASVSAAPRATILVVEDEPAVRSLAEKVLDREGYRVLTAPDGRQALQVWETAMDSIDLVLTDVVMPEMGGPEMVQRMREERPDLRVLYSSGYTRNYAIDRGLADGRVHMLEKPFTPESLLREVRTALERRPDGR